MIWEERKNRDFKIHVDKGALTCKKLKELYPDLDWYQVADKFTLCKQKGRKVFNLDDFALLRKLSECSLDELKDLIEIM